MSPRLLRPGGHTQGLLHAQGGWAAVPGEGALHVQRARTPSRQAAGGPETGIQPGGPQGNMAGRGWQGR